MGETNRKRRTAPLVVVDELAARRRMRLRLVSAEDMAAMVEARGMASPDRPDMPGFHTCQPWSLKPKGNTRGPVAMELKPKTNTRGWPDAFVTEACWGLGSSINQPGAIRPITPAFCSVSRGQRRLGEKEYRAPSVTPGLHFAPELRRRR